MFERAATALERELAVHERLARPGTIVDIGAHFGDFGFELARHPGLNVLMIEPLPMAASAIRERLLNSDLNVKLIETALSDWTGDTTLSIPILFNNDPVWQWASIVKDFESLAKDNPEIEDVKKIAVRVTTLDSLSVGTVTGIKLDAEGAEYEILRGARRLIASSQPFISVELEERHRSGCTYTVPAFLDALGYECFFEIDSKLVAFNYFNRNTMQAAGHSPADQCYSVPYVNCFYFVPRSEQHLIEMITNSPL